MILIKPNFSIIIIKNVFSEDRSKRLQNRSFFKPHGPIANLPISHSRNNSSRIVVASAHLLFHSRNNISRNEVA